MEVGELQHRIKELKEIRNAIILAHNYQLPEVQDVGDFLGDSLGLSLKASRADADVIVFCGVNFMAESAKILSPGKTVLLPDITSYCPMAAMISSGSWNSCRAVSTIVEMAMARLLAPSKTIRRVGAGAMREPNEGHSTFRAYLKTGSPRPACGETGWG